MLLKTVENNGFYYYEGIDEDIYNEIALDLDEEYKYIIPTNSAAKDTIFGRITNGGQYEIESD